MCNLYFLPFNYQLSIFNYRRPPPKLPPEREPPPPPKEPLERLELDELLPE